LGERYRVSGGRGRTASLTLTAPLSRMDRNDIPRSPPGAADRAGVQPESLARLTHGWNYTLYILRTGMRGNDLAFPYIERAEGSSYHARHKGTYTPKNFLTS